MTVARPGGIEGRGRGRGCRASADSNRRVLARRSTQIKKGSRLGPFFYLAEREGFEPSVHLRVRLISSQVLSTAQPPLRTLGHAHVDRPTAWPPAHGPHIIMMVTGTGKPNPGFYY